MNTQIRLISTDYLNTNWFELYFKGDHGTYVERIHHTMTHSQLSTRIPELEGKEHIIFDLFEKALQTNRIVIKNI